MDPETLDARLRAVERAVTGDGEVPRADDAIDCAARLDACENRLDELEERVDELDAATQAVRGYVGGVRAVNRDVERRADAALAKIESLERATDGGNVVDTLREETARTSGGQVVESTATPQARDAQVDDEQECGGLAARLRDLA